MKKLLLSIVLMMVGVVVNGANNGTCVYPDTELVMKEMGRFENWHSWDVLCSLKTIGKYYEEHGFVKADIEVMVEKYNRALRAGEEAATVKEFGGDAVALYEALIGDKRIQILDALTKDIIENYFGSQETYTRLGVNMPATWYTDSGAYDKSYGMAGFLRNTTKLELGLGILKSIETTIKRTEKECAVYRQDYKDAFERYCGYLDTKYTVCQTIVGK